MKKNGCDLKKIFDNLNIKPIVAVIPKNKDRVKEQLFESQFLGNSAALAKQGWSIAMHGFERQFHEIDRRRSIVPLHDRSEFVGLELEQQRKKIKNSLSIFKKNNVFPSVWVAPAHSFDSVTLDALTQETQIRTVSDGLSIFHSKE